LRLHRIDRLRFCCAATRVLQRSTMCGSNLRGEFDRQADIYFRVIGTL
jgi:hypothetical protein